MAQGGRFRAGADYIGSHISWCLLDDYLATCSFEVALHRMRPIPVEEPGLEREHPPGPDLPAETMPHADD